MQNSSLLTYMLLYLLDFQMVNKQTKILPTLENLDKGWRELEEKEDGDVHSVLVFEILQGMF